MRQSVQLLGVILLVTAFIACRETQNTPDTSVEEVSEAIAAQNEVLMSSVADRDLETLLGIYTDDAWFMPQHSPPLKGKEAISKFFEQIFELGVELELSTDEVTVHGNSAVEIGHYRQLSNGEETDRGTYLIVWKKEGDEWLLHRDIFNTDLPRPGQEEE